MDALPVQGGAARVGTEISVLIDTSVWFEACSSQFDSSKLSQESDDRIMIRSVPLSLKGTAGSG